MFWERLLYKDCFILHPAYRYPYWGRMDSHLFLGVHRARDQLLRGKTDDVWSHQQSWRLKWKQNPSQRSVKKGGSVNGKEVSRLRSGKVSQVLKQEFQQDLHTVPRLPATLKGNWLRWMLMQDYLICNMQCRVQEFKKNTWECILANNAWTNRLST